MLNECIKRKRPIWFLTAVVSKNFYPSPNPFLVKKVVSTWQEADITTEFLKQVVKTLQLIVDAVALDMHVYLVTFNSTQPADSFYFICMSFHNSPRNHNTDVSSITYILR